MKDLFKRVTALALCLAMLTALLASCADDNDTTLVDPSVTNVDDSGAPTFVEEDFDGETFTILSSVYETTGDNFYDNYIDNEEVNGEPVNDAVIARNKAVEDKYNVVVEGRHGGAGDAATAAKSGTVDFEVVYEWGIRQTANAVDGYYYDFHQIPYLDLDQKYWTPSAQNDLTIADKMLITMCDISMNGIGHASFIIFNKRLLDDFGVEYPYELVNTNQWTVDKYHELILECGGLDTNGDTVWDAEDVYASSSRLLDLAVSGSGIDRELTIKNEDGTYTVNVYTDKLVSIYSKYKDLDKAMPDGVYDEEGIDWAEGRDTSMYNTIFEARRVISFGEGHFAFGSTAMAYIEELVNMEDEYGVVPKPKYDASQTAYYHYTDPCAPMFTVIKQADMDLVGIIMEYMAYESMERVVPAFYEQNIKTKSMTDLEGRDEKMLDLIRDNIYYSWTGLYEFSIKKKDGSTWNPVGVMKNEMLASGNFASVNKRYLSSAQTSLDDFYDKILDLDVNK